MVMTFAERIRQRAAPAKEDASGNPFLSVLQAFADGLTQEGRAVARLEPGAHPQRYYLVLHAHHRPSQRHPMLTAWVEREQVTIWIENTLSFTEPTALEKRLEDFVAQPAFQDSLAELARIATEPVEAYLRATRPGVLSRDDVMVEVSSVDQVRLDQANVGSSVTLTVRPSSFPGSGRFDAGHNYVALDSAGIGLEVTAQRAVTDGLEVTCVKLGPRT